ncbi:transmembrane protein 44 isoform X2 [Halichoeres trimaculatus]|uniref:transmembrane protein 44 isoform X2 n=1 Tax=Halichoeres trimaculatus TaxID=147232 RepID=UPI003D9E296C
MKIVEATRGNSDTFFSNLANFWADLVSTCLSLDADKPCVSTGLSCLSALLSLLSCFLLVYQRCKHRRGNPGETITSFYKFFGNLCSTVGAVLSNQLYILVKLNLFFINCTFHLFKSVETYFYSFLYIFIGAFAAAVDVIHIISCCFHLCLNSQAEKRRRMMKGRRRQHLLIMCVLFVVGGGFLKPWVIHHSAENSLNGRKLLHVNLQVGTQTSTDSTEFLGYTLGLLSFVISCTSRLPALSQAHRGQMLTWVYVFSGLLSGLAGAFYAAALLLYDAQFISALRALPWLLSAICCVFLDLLILVICWCKRETKPQTNFSTDTESLLGCSSLFTEDKSVMKKHRKQQVHSSSQTKTKNVQKPTEMGRYMDVQSTTKTCPQMDSNNEGEHQPLYGTVRVIRFNSFCSSDSLCDSSLESSDLEWDFEEANAQWNETTAKQQEKVKFSLQEWHPQPCKSCICAMFGPLQNTSPGEDDIK